MQMPYLDPESKVSYKLRLELLGRLKTGQKRFFLNSRITKFITILSVTLDFYGTYPERLRLTGVECHYIDISPHSMATNHKLTVRFKDAHT